MKKKTMSRLSLLLVVCLVFACVDIYGCYSAKESLNDVKDVREKVVFAGTAAGVGESVSEIVDRINSNEGNRTMVILQLDNPYEIELEGTDEYMSLDEAKAYLKQRRATGKAYYSQTNPLILANLDMSAFDITFTADTYTPYAYAEYEAVLTEKDIEDIYVLAESEKIDRIYVQPMAKAEGELTGALDAIDGTQIASNSSTNGTGIVIGILESQYVCKDNSYFEDVNVTTRVEVGPAAETDHATKVAISALAMAPGASILSASQDTGIIGAVSWMLDNDVNIINMSYHTEDVTENGTYTVHSSYFDNVARNYGVVFTGSAGNNQDGTYYVTPPNGFNTLTVGSCDYNGVRSSFSSYKEKFDVNFPRLVAPGENLYIPTMGTYSGTSYSAPLVAGAAAALMDRLPFLINYPHVVMALLMASTQRIEQYATSSGFNNEIGAGMLNVQNAMDNIYNRNYFTVSEDQVGEFVGVSMVYLEAGQRIRIAFVSMVTADVSTNTDLVTDYDLYLYDYDGAMKASCLKTYNNEFIDYVVTSTGYYYIKVKQYAAKKTVYDDYCAYAWNIE